MAQLALELPVGVKPPAAPWSPLRIAQPATGYLSVYLADDPQPAAGEAYHAPP